MPITESSLVIPALQAMHQSPNGEIQTSDLITEIASQFTLDANDLSPLLNRNDEKFTQKVRNLKSHKTIDKLGYAEEIPGGFRLTQTGKRFLEDNGFIQVN